MIWTLFVFAFKNQTKVQFDYLCKIWFYDTLLVGRPLENCDLAMMPLLSLKFWDLCWCKNLLFKFYFNSLSFTLYVPAQICKMLNFCFLRVACKQMGGMVHSVWGRWLWQLLKSSCRKTRTSVWALCFWWYILLRAVGDQWAFVNQEWKIGAVLCEDASYTCGVGWIDGLSDS